MAHRTLPGALLLVLHCACARPRTTPAPWPEQVQGAARPLAAELSPAERRDFESGFANGAAMVQEALKSGRRPYRPVADLPAAAPRILGPRSGDPVPVPQRPKPNVDPATGLLMFPAQTFGSAAFGRGQVAGFDWALAGFGQTLVKPVPRLQAPSEWLRWKDLAQGNLVCGEVECEVKWAPGLLAWGLTGRGFPQRRNWRPWEEPEAPAWAALGPGSLWVETADAQVFVIDLDTGGILDTRAASPHPVPAWEAPENQVLSDLPADAPELLAELERRCRAAEGGDPVALVALGNLLAGRGEAWEAEALGCFRRAAEAGDADAMLLLAVWLHHGRGGAQDQAASRLWVERALRAGHPEAGGVLKELFP